MSGIWEINFILRFFARDCKYRLFKFQLERQLFSFGHRGNKTGGKQPFRHHLLNRAMMQLAEFGFLCELKLRLLFKGFAP